MERTRKAGGAKSWRGWLLLALLLGIAAAWTWNAALREVEYEQQRTLGGMQVVLLGVLALALWTLFAAPFGWRGRLGLLAAGVLLLGAATLLVEVRGFTGDVQPIFAWRFAREPAPTDPASPATIEAGAGDLAPGSWSDAPQFLGPDRVPVTHGFALERDWERRPPRVIWRRAVGQGWSSFAVAGEHAITQEQRGEQELVVAYGVLDGAPRWQHAHAARYGNEMTGPGPRATPTVGEGRVFAVGGTGVLCALDLRSGAELWSADVVAASGGKLQEWGYSSSPLLTQGRVILAGGEGGDANLVAFDADSGALAWTGRAGAGSYSSPVLAELHGVVQVIAHNADSLSGHDPADGHLLWRAERSVRAPVVGQPLVLADGRVFVSTGYGEGSACYRLERGPGGRFAVEREWSSLALKSKFATYVERGGLIYGLDDGTLACLELATGGRAWKAGRYGHGQVRLVGDLLLVSGEGGELLLLETSTQEPRELARLPVLDGRAWNVPALAPPLLLVRNDREAVCLRLAARSPTGEDAR